MSWASLLFREHPATRLHEKFSIVGLGWAIDGEPNLTI
jgi:hypothetical protein